jgi:hypothetical protein
VCCRDSGVSWCQSEEDEGTDSSDQVQLALDGKAEVIEVKIVQVIIERVFAIDMPNKHRNLNTKIWNTYISCPISRKPRRRNAEKAVPGMVIHLKVL